MFWSISSIRISASSFSLTMISSRPWLLASGLLALVWGGVAVVMRMTDHAVSSPEVILSLLESTDWKSAKLPERSEHLERVIAKMNRLSHDQRAELRGENQEALDSFFEGLTPEEQAHYVDQTVTPRIEAILKGLRAMPEPDRRSFVARIRKDLRERPPSGMPEEFALADEETFHDIMDESLESQFKDASIETKLKFAPMLENIQTRLQGFGRR